MRNPHLVWVYWRDEIMNDIFTRVDKRHLEYGREREGNLDFGIIRGAIPLVPMYYLQILRRKNTTGLKSD